MRARMPSGAWGDFCPRLYCVFPTDVAYWRTRMAFARGNNPKYRRGVAALLATLWSLYALLGASGLCRVTLAATPSPHGRSLNKVQAPSPACVCRVCHGLLRGGKRHCCCKTAQTPQRQAAVTARCDQGTPAVLAAVNSWPVLRSGTTVAVPPQFDGPRFTCATHQFAPSFSLSPLTPPPCLQ